MLAFLKAARCAESVILLSVNARLSVSVVDSAQSGLVAASMDGTLETNRIQSDCCGCLDGVPGWDGL